jgi:FtsP/CotA-like multicopper oxidase with cupredoxin domain
MTGQSTHFPTDTTGLPLAHAPELVDRADQEQFDLRIAPVAKKLGDATVRMLAYNGSIPGPTIRVPQGSELSVHVVNEGDLETTVHWHGLRLENRYDGTAETQTPMPIGGRFTYRIKFTDPGVYWYHPHIREDYAQEMGLYGTIVVVPSEPDYWPPANRELAITLDDILIENGRVAPFSRSESTYTAMGRFGNVFLVNGEPELAMAAKQGEIVRLYVTNTANTRVFNIFLTDARLKLVGGDSGHYEHEKFVENVIIAPSERVVVDVLFEKPGQATLEHRTPQQTYRLATINVIDEPAKPSLASQFDELRTNSDLAAERERISKYLNAQPEKILALVAEMDMGEPELPYGAAIVYFCPMHLDVSSSEPGRCPKCGMKLLAKAAEPDAYVCPMHPEVRAHQADRCPKCGMKLLPEKVIRKAAEGGHAGSPADHHHPAPNEAHGGHGTSGVEWEDDMVDVNRITTPANTRWKLIDKQSGAEGSAINWRFRVGDRVKIRLLNTMDSDHPMHHPFHIHGAGRFLVLSRDGEIEPDLVWKDTVLVQTGQTVDILLEVSNPGRWMAHCHIAEHHESGMMFSFDVDP